MTVGTTLVAVVAGNARELVIAAGESAANVSAETAGAELEDPVRSARLLDDVWRRARRHGSIYTLVDVDPLASVVDEWAARLEGRAHDLEVAIGLVGDRPAPDFYLVDAELAEPAVHWYLGLVRRAAAARVVVVPATAGAILSALAELDYGPPLPPAADLAARARDYVPRPPAKPL